MNGRDNIKQKRKKVTRRTKKDEEWGGRLIGVQKT